MKNCKKCKHNCGNCKYALVVENDEQPYLERPEMYDERDVEGERQAVLGIYQWQTPLVTMCYLPEEKKCNYEVQTDKTLLSETHPQIFIEQMTDLYECIPIEKIKQLVENELEKANTVGLDDREQLWHKIHLAICERKTAHD